MRNWLRNDCGLYGLFSNDAGWLLVALADDGGNIIKNERAQRTQSGTDLLHSPTATARPLPHHQAGGEERTITKLSIASIVG